MISKKLENKAENITRLPTNLFLNLLDAAPTFQYAFIDQTLQPGNFLDTVNIWIPDYYDIIG